jgi:hypothetical protein
MQAVIVVREVRIGEGYVHQADLAQALGAQRLTSIPKTFEPNEVAVVVGKPLPGRVMSSARRTLARPAAAIRVGAASYLSGAAVTMPWHAVIAQSLPAGLNTGSLAQGISVTSSEVTPSPMPDPTGCPGAQVSASAHPRQGGTARRASVPSRASPRPPRGGTILVARPHCRPVPEHLHSAKLAAGGGKLERSLFHNQPHRRYSSQQSARFSLAISPSRSPHREYGGRLIGGNR